MDDLWEIPLKLDPHNREPTQDEIPWMVSENNTLHYAIGIIDHLDHVEVAHIRRNDLDMSHNAIWPIAHPDSKWRITEHCILFMSGYRPDPEQTQKIYDAFAHHIRKHKCDQD